MAREDKAAAVAEIADAFRSSNATVLTEYRGLTVAQLKALRRTLGPTTQYAVVKNTLTKIAAEQAGVEGLHDHLYGPSAIAFISGDPVEAAKSLREFAKANPALIIKVGYMDGRALSAADVASLADLEPREVVLAKFAGAMKSKTAQAAALFQAPLAKAIRTMDALRDKLPDVSVPVVEVAAPADTPADPVPADAALADAAPADAVLADAAPADVDAASTSDSASPTDEAGRTTNHPASPTDSASPTDKTVTTDETPTTDTEG